MSHTHKDCRITFEDEREGGNRGSLHIKASPRKGLSKNKEKVEALRGRGKQLFTPKSKIKDVTNNMISSLNIEVTSDHLVNSGDILEPSFEKYVDFNPQKGVNNNSFNVNKPFVSQQQYKRHVHRVEENIVDKDLMCEVVSLIPGEA